MIDSLGVVFRNRVRRGNARHGLQDNAAVLWRGGGCFSRLCPGDMQTVESWDLKFEHAGLLNVYFKQLEVRAAWRLSF